VKRTLTKKLAVTAGAAALAFGAVACEAENGDGLDPAQEDPMMEDDGLDDGLEDDGAADDGMGDEGDDTLDE
jgi:hypothetical protein